jgi:MFS family permease
MLLHKKSQSNQFDWLFCLLLRMDTKPSIYSFKFWMLCCSNFLFSASFVMIIPELPDHLTKMGGQQYLGYNLALFTLMAGISRPFSGKLSDTVGRVPVMIFGSLACVVCSALYPFISVVGGFLLLRFLHGLSTGTKPTATSAYIADIIPENRRGEAAGMLGIFTAIGMSLGPAIGPIVVKYLNVNWMFGISSFLALLSIAILFNLEETLINKQKFSWSLFRIRWVDVIEPRVMTIFVVMLLSSIPTGVVLTLSPDTSKFLNLDKGIYFVIYSSSTLLIRFCFKSVADKYGREPIILIFVLLLALSMFLLAWKLEAWIYYFSAIIFGGTWGIGLPALTAYCIDLSHPDFRARALATMFMGFEAGICLGSLMAGYMYLGRPENIPLIYGLSGISCVLGFLYLKIKKKSNA